MSSFFLCFDNSAKNQGLNKKDESPPRLFKCYNHRPCARPAHVCVGENRGSQMVMMRFQSPSADDGRWRVLRVSKRDCTASALQYKSVRVTKQKRPSGCREVHHSAGFEPSLCYDCRQRQFG